MRVVEVLEQFLTAKKGQKRKLRSIDFYAQVISRFIAWMEAEKLGDQVGAVRPDVIDRFMASEADRLAAATLHGRYRALNALFNWAESRRELKKHLYRRLSPMREVEPPTVPRREQKAISYADWQRLLKAINFESWIGARDYLLVMTLFLSGIRASELIRLQVEDFDFESRLLVIREGKRGDYECVPLLEPVARAFVAFLFVRPAWPTTEVFLAADGSAEPKPDGVLTRSVDRGDVGVSRSALV